MRAPETETLAVVLAGGEGSRLEPLTDRRAKPAVRFGGVHRLIDFPLSNCRNSRMPAVWVIEQYEPHSLADHLANGRPWDLDRTIGGLQILHPHLGRDGSGFHAGTADAIAKTMPFIRERDPRYLLVLSSDHVYRLDYRDVLDAHDRAGADLTIVTTTTEDDPSRFGVVETDGDRVTRFVRKPDEPATETISTEVFVFSLDALAAALDAVQDDEPEEDLGDDVIPHLVEHGDVRAWSLDGYWRDVGTLSSYLDGHRDLLGREPTLDLAHADWPILAQPLHLPPGYVGTDAAVHDSAIAPGAVVEGTVRRSVVGPGAVVEPGAVVVDAVLLDGARVGRDASVRVTVLDERSSIGAGATVGGDVQVDDDHVTVVGDGVTVGDGEVVDPGARLRAGDS